MQVSIDEKKNNSWHIFINNTNNNYIKNKIAIILFIIKNIEIENNFLLKKKEIKILLAPLYKKIFFLSK